MYPDTKVFLRSVYLTCEDLPGDTFHTAFFDQAFVTQIGIVSPPLKTPIYTAQPRNRNSKLLYTKQIEINNNNKIEIKLAFNLN